MSTQGLQLPLPLPKALEQWLILNSEYYVIICHSTDCKQALRPNTITRHLRDKHQVKREIRQQLDKYLQQWQWPYDSRSVPLPLDMSPPQPVLPVINGFQCKDCVYLTSNRWVIRQHCNTKHNKKKRLDDEKLFRAADVVWGEEGAILGSGRDATVT